MLNVVLTNDETGEELEIWPCKVPFVDGVSIDNPDGSVENGYEIYFQEIPEELRKKFDLIRVTIKEEE